MTNNISAKIIADSISENGDRITTFELEYPRFIHGELMTHRLFSRNAMSSRAIPVKKMIEQVRNNPAVPVHWGKNQSGMQAKEELSGEVKVAVKDWWNDAANAAAEIAEAMDHANTHKQIVNRLLEPFQRMKTVVTATEYDNFFYLRCHADAQPEIHALADLMYSEYENSTPQLLQEGQWHTPYVGNSVYADTGEGFAYHLEDEDGEVICMLGEEEALKISASCCAQVSYRNTDQSLEKALKIYDMLVTMKPVHASPFEHQAKPLITWMDGNYPEGTTHVDMKGNEWSGNFKGWIQHRQLIKDNVCNSYEEEV